MDQLPASTLPPSQRSTPPVQVPGCASWLVLALVVVGIAATSYIRYSIVLGTSVSVGDNTWMYGLFGAAGQFLLLVLPLALLSRFWPEARHRPLYLAWLLASGLNLLLSPVHLLPLPAAQTRLLAQIVLVALFSWGVWAVHRRRAGAQAPAADPGDAADPAGGPMLVSGAAAPGSADHTAELWNAAAATETFASEMEPANPTLAEVPAADTSAAGTSAAEALFETAAYPGRSADHPSIDPASLDRPRLRWLAAGAIGLAMLAPWMARGAQGSFLDSLLALLLALALGAATALLGELFILTPLRLTRGSRAEDFFLAGLGIGAVLVLVAAATAFAIGGLQLMLLIALPGLGWSIAGLNMLFPGPRRYTSPRRLLDRLGPSALLAGLAFAGPLVWIDPDELALIVAATSGEMLGVAFGAAFNALWVALLSGAAFLAAGTFTARRLNLFTRPAGQIGCLAALALVAIAALAWGLSAASRPDQPVFNGERLFVILKDQADLSQAGSIADPVERRRFVYQALVQQADTSQADLRADLERLGVPYTPYYLVNAIEVHGEPVLRFWLAARPDVDRVLDSPRMRPLPEPLPVSSGSERLPSGTLWSLKLIGADRVWQDFGVRGEGIVVGQSDSGVQWDHPELIETYRGGQAGADHNYNWFDPWNGTPQPTDIGGHGTHTLGTIAGQRTGVAPGVSWFACSNLARNLGNPALYLDCWQFMLAPFPLVGNPLRDGDPARGAHVLNNSWGCPSLEGCDINTFLAAAQALRQAGVFVVASAGNEGPGCETLNTPPPVYDETFAVGAIDRSRRLTIFSSIGPVTKDGSGRVKPDVVAPGQDVLSSLPQSSYGSFSGTSMAGPHVVGVVALMWSANPALIGQVDATAHLLRSTAQPYTGYRPNCPGAEDEPSTAVGYGIVDAYAAVEAARAWKP